MKRFMKNKVLFSLTILFLVACIAFGINMSYGAYIRRSYIKAVIATNETRTVREFVDIAFKCAGIEIEWKGTGVDEVGINKANGKTVVKVSPKFFRPAEVDILLGNPEKAEKTLGWKREISFAELVERMVKNDMALVEKEIKISKLG